MLSKWVAEWMYNSRRQNRSGRFTGYTYVEILDEIFLSSVKAMVFPDPKPFYLVQDDSSIHTSSLVMG